MARILSRTRLFPTSSPKLTRTPLSIVDSTVVRFAPSAGVWIFKEALAVEKLTESLKLTLDAYPQWSGQLQWSDYNPSGNHNERLERLVLAYGTSSDPGVEFIVATSSHNTSSFANDSVDGCTDVTNLPFPELIDPSALLALHDAVNYSGPPSLIIQITTLSDGGVAIGVKFAHPLADAQTLLQFTHDWAATSRGVMGEELVPTLSPIFDPSLLDAAAAGDIDSSHPSSALLEVADRLPLHRYDCWNSKANCPPCFDLLTSVPPGLLESAVGQLGNPIHWSNWDYTAPVSHFLVEFTPNELQAMWKDATSIARVSHLDALMAHIWNLIIRARALLDGEYYLNVTFGFRNRLDPPLSPAFLGSPLTSMKVTATAEDVADHNLGPIAVSIRRSLSAFNASTLPALLHQMAFEASPLRVWNAFFGSRNTIVTSWLQLGMRDVDFGTGVPTHIEAVMPSTDGCVQIMEAYPNGPAEEWYKSGATVSLHFRDDVVQKMLKDPALRKYQ